MQPLRVWWMIVFRWGGVSALHKPRHRNARPHPTPLPRKREPQEASLQARKARTGFGFACALMCMATAASAGDFQPAAQHFQQEVATNFVVDSGLPADPVQILQCNPEGIVDAFIEGKWYSCQGDKWELKPRMTAATPDLFVFP